MKIGPYLLFGLCLSLIGASPAPERALSAGGDSEGSASRVMPALAAAQDGSLCMETTGRRFEFGAGELAVSMGNSSWSYRFRGSRGGVRALSISTLPERTAEGSLEYRHAEGIIERYIVQSRGVEQQFLLPGPYAGGDVLLTGSVQTDLEPEAASSFEGIAFQRDGETVLFYGAAKAVDSAGRTALLEERWADGELTIVVPAAFLAAAQPPVLVDPWIGGMATVDAAVDLAQNPALAAREGSTTFQALAVWSTDIISPQRIRGRIIGPRGNTIVGPISVVDEFTLDTYFNPRVAWSPSDSVWVVAAEGHGGGGATPNFIEVNKVSTAGVKTTGGNLNSPGDPEQEVDVACNNAGQCLVVWVYDSDASGTTDKVRGVFYAPGTNTFGAQFDFFPGTATAHHHPRVASNGTDYYVVIDHGTTNIDGYSVTTGGTLTADDPSQSGTTRVNPEVSYNASLAKYLVVWDTGGTSLRGCTMTNATPPVVSIGDTLIGPNASKPELTSQQFAGWALGVFSSGGTNPTLALIRPNVTLGWVERLGLDGSGAAVSLDVAHFFRGLSTVVYEDDRGSATDHDIRAREFITPATDYADFDNDGWASAFVWRPGSSAYFYYSNDLSSGTPPATSVQFGTTGDIPVRTAFNGGGIPDLTVFRPSTGYWYIDVNHDGTVDAAIQFGTNGDIPVPGDYDFDGVTDFAVFRPSTGYWYILTSSSGFVTTISVQFGTNGDIPVPADYDGDFRTDIAVWRPSTGYWYVNTGLNGVVNIQAQFGTAGDIPVPGDYGPSNGSGYPDGKADFAVFRPSTGTWYVSRDRNGVVDLAVQFGTAGDIPIGGIYNSNPDINSPFAVFRPSNGTSYVDVDNNGTVNFSSQFGAAGDYPMQQPSGQSRH